MFLEKSMNIFVEIMQHKMHNKGTESVTRGNQNYDLTTSGKSNKCSMWKNKRKREANRKYILPFAEMNFSRTFVIFLFILSVLPITLSDSFNNQKPSNLHDQKYAIGKSIPRKP